jgi:hypothetical protein
MYECMSLKDHGRLVAKSNQKPVGDLKYMKATFLILSQYVSEISRVPVKNWLRTSSCSQKDKSSELATRI